MRVGVAASVLVLLVSPASAEVHITMREDGRRVIYNVPTGKAARVTNWNWLARQQDRPSRYDPIIERYAQQYGVNPTLIRAVIQVESDFNPRTVSKKGACGLMQLIPGTARRYGVADIYDPEENIRGGVRYLSDLMAMFAGDLPRVLAAYNAGENAVIRHGGIPPYQETATYVKRALTVYYGRPYGQSLMFAGDPRKATLRGGFSTDPLAVAMLPRMRVLGTN